MSKTPLPLISIVVPIYNESHGLAVFHQTLVKQLSELAEYTYEVVYVNDGSSDDSATIIDAFAAKDPHVKLLSLTRNFGKEIAVTAGLHTASGEAIITLDGDGQHPVELIPQFVGGWRAGHKVVVGVRDTNQREGVVKRAGSKLFYRLFKRITGHQLMMPNATDYRLIDRSVAGEFARLTERNRSTRGQIAWLGYPQSYVHYTANPRLYGTAGYSFTKLVKLAVDSFISYSVSPLYLVAYVGAVVLPISVLIGLIMLVNALLGDPLNWHATGSAYVIVLLLFLVGVLLVSQGIIGLYLSHIHTETQNRPLYVIDTAKSRGINEG